MRIRTRSVVFFLAYFLSNCAAVKSDKADLVITHVHVIDVVTGTILPDQNVVVSDGLIQRVESAKNAPQRGLVALFLALSLGLSNCGGSSNPEPQVPFISFNESLSVLDQRYPQLRTDNGAVELPNGGVRGLIIVRQNANTYLAFERNCPYRPYEACATVSVDASRLFLVDSCCGSQFTLQGQVRGGPATRPLRQYATSLSGNLLVVTN